jgi:L-lactate utilization protein LutB
VTRPLAASDRRQLTKASHRRALRAALRYVRCPSCNRSGALHLEGGIQAGCGRCGATFNTCPEFQELTSWSYRPFRVVARIHPEEIAP